MTNNRQVKRREGQSTSRQITEIWDEKACRNNPYIPEKCSCYGYDLLELMEKRSFIDVLFLLFQGELPNSNQAKLLESLMIAFVNPGPRHPATRAAMAAGVGKTDPALILPVSLSILSGTHLGAGCIAETMKFFGRQSDADPIATAQALVEDNCAPQDGDWFPAPGFGSRFGGIDRISKQIADRLIELPAAGKALKWGVEFAAAASAFGIGWLPVGVVAATLSDLRVKPESGAGLFQLICAPGLLAHGLELSDKPFSAMPFPSDKDYHIEES